MSITYCFSCGKKITYEVTKPDDCPACKKSLGSVFKASESTASLPKTKKQPKYSEYVNDDDNADFEIIIPDSNDVQVEGRKRFTVANLKNGDAPPAFSPASDLPADTEVTSRAFFQKQE